ncbi:hypothetical protein DGG96_18350 [Legionella qingyii]|uniref:Uncharacterized protein n=1 Tax=Legionella qingyii TaxID=2184757 RepID=A0A317TXE5_9GAMM|nr:hypothetical protein [Legionella qingyii]PWY54173.1 hypothetical protein DGG96_18350 [Legionella qingyii]RUR23593.1 hypothetical protein ELY16_13100 [Legionella qingyii]RUR24072.1 hypothetical protein ELY20_05780 [Legionella qingyii]
MRAKFFNKKPIPKTSQNAFALLNSDTLSTVGTILSNFIHLINIEKSVLTHPNSAISDNQKFLKELEAGFNKLRNALEHGKPYRSLFNDVCKLKEGLEVIFGYYQTQIELCQPIAKDYLRKIRSEDSEVATLLHKIAYTEKQYAFHPKESKIIKKHIINVTAQDVMEQDMTTIREIVQQSLSVDHQDESENSCIRSL